jgi:hypothetical protein
MMQIEHECDELPLNERCTDCIEEYYDGKMQLNEDMFRDE